MRGWAGGHAACPFLLDPRRTQPPPPPSGMSNWELAAASSLAGTCKSVLLALAVIEASRRAARRQGAGGEAGIARRARSFPRAHPPSLPPRLPPYLQGQVSVKDAVRAARLEEDVQSAEWGEVEGGHVIDAAEVLVRVGAPSVFVRLARLDGGGGR